MSSLLDEWSFSSNPQCTHLKIVIFTDLFERHEMVYPNHVLQCLAHSYV